MQLTTGFWFAKLVTKCEQQYFTFIGAHKWLNIKSEIITSIGKFGRLLHSSANQDDSSKKKKKRHSRFLLSEGFYWINQLLLEKFDIKRDNHSIHLSIQTLLYVFHLCNLINIKVT